MESEFQGLSRSTEIVNGLMDTLREETVHLIQKGDDLSTQMHLLYRSVNSFVQTELNNISTSPKMYMNEENSDVERGSLTTYGGDPDNKCRVSGYDSGYNSGQLCGGKFVQRGLQWDLTASQVEKLTAEMSSGFRLKSPVGDPGQENIPQGSSLLDSLDSRNENGIYSYKPDLTSYSCTRCGVSNTNVLGVTKCSGCYNSQDSSPVTVSSGYSSDKDSCIREEDIDELLNSHNGGSTRVLNEDTLSCDSELVRIYETCKELGRPLTEQFPEDLPSEQLPINNDDILEYTCNNLSDKEFIPINYESLCKKDSISCCENVTVEETINYTPLFSQIENTEKTDNKNSSNGNLVKKTLLRRHHSMLEKNSKRYIRVAQSVDDRQGISPPPITALPGFHPAWCGSLHEEAEYTEEEEKLAEHLAVSHCSAFHPFASRLTRSRSFLEKDLNTMYEVPVSSRKTAEDTIMRTDHHLKVQPCHPEPVYASVNSIPKRTLVYSSSSDSGNSSTEYCVECQSPCFSSGDEGIFESGEHSVVYEPIDEDPIYEYVPSVRPGNEIPQFKDTPPKLPKRNPVTRPNRSQTGESPCVKRSFQRHPVKLEDIVKPSDIVDISGKHLYTVADVLASVEKLAEDMPTYANDGKTLESSKVSEKLKRSVSCAAALSKSNKNEDLKGFKKIFSPRSARKPKRSTSYKVDTKDSQKVKSQTSSDFCLEEEQSESVHGLLVVPTHYGLQFKSSVQCTPQMEVRSKVNAGHVTSITNCTDNSAIAWNSLSSSKEIFC